MKGKPERLTGSVSIFNKAQKAYLIYYHLLSF